MDNRLALYANNLTVDFRMAAYVEQPPEDCLYNYVPEFSSIGFILSGEGSIVADGVDLRPAPGDLYLLPARTLQSYSSFSANSYKKYYCHFQATSGGVSLFDVVKVPLCFRAKDPAAVEAIFRELCALQATADPLAPLRIRSLTEQLIYLYLSDAPSIRVESIQSKKRDPIGDTLLYIERHLAEELSVQQLAARLFFSPDYFTRLFKSVTGETPRRYITRIRNQKAVRLLLSTEMSVAEIAAATGFETPAYFSNTFKKMNGLSPADFRKVSRRY